MGNTSQGYYHRKPFRDDAPVRPDPVTSVLDTRRVYNHMTDKQFVKMYVRKYRTGLSEESVQKILDKDREKKAEQATDAIK